MELWIRSQDKECLLKTDIVEMEYFGEECFVSINTRFDGKNASLGEYSTRERALEVLDEIQHKLITLCDSMNRHLYVYEMPKE